MATTLEGDFKDLFAKLNALDARMSTRVLRSAVRRAARLTLNKMKAAAPQGSVPHRTYKGRLVAPGYLRRSLRVVTKIDRRQGVASAILGTRREAFYGTQFLDQGPWTVTQRKYKQPGKKRRAVRAIKPYTIQKRPWFESVFLANRQQMENDFVQFMRAEIDKAVRTGK